MGNGTSSSSGGPEEILVRAIADDEARLYWAYQPYEGPLKMRFRCGACRSEAILVQPYPQRWRDLVDLRGECFQCADAGARIHTLFFEAKPDVREPLWTFDGRASATLAEHVRRFLQWVPPTRDGDGAEARVGLLDVVRPRNFRRVELDHAYVGGASLSLSPKIPARMDLRGSELHGTPSPVSPQPQSSHRGWLEKMGLNDPALSSSASDMRSSPLTEPHSGTRSAPLPSVQIDGEQWEQLTIEAAGEAPPPRTGPQLVIENGATSALTYELAMLALDPSMSWLKLFKSRRGSDVRTDFMWDAKAIGLPLEQKHALLLHVLREQVSNRLLARLVVSRDHLVHDLCQLFLQCTPRQLRGYMKLEFSGERGVDLKGVMREAMTLCTESLLDPRSALFDELGASRRLFPSVLSRNEPAHLSFFLFLGRLLGRALLEGVQLRAPFSRVLFTLLLGKPLRFSDMQFVDRETYANVVRALECPADVVDSLELVFAVDTQELGTTKTHELVPHGLQVPVTHENVLEWARLYAEFKMVRSVRPQLMHLLEGFYDVIPVSVLSLLNERELEQVLCGVTEVDVDEWRVNSATMGFRTDQRHLIDWFWTMVKGMDAPRHGQLLHFATGSSQAPLSFKLMHPPFTLAYSAALSKDSLPRAHTCFCRLDIPSYSSYDIMLDRFEKALDYGLYGFEKA